MANGVLDRIYRTFGPGVRLSRTDVSVLSVAMMIAALDGRIDESELMTFERLMKKCPGYNEKSGAQAMDKAIRAAGYLEVQARRLSERQLVDGFVEEALDMLPDRFLCGSPVEVRRAIVMWTLMAMSDENYSAVERRAVTMLAARVAGAMSAIFTNVGRGLAPSFCSGTVAAFLRRVEGLASQLRQEATQSDAEEALRRLIED